MIEWYGTAYAGVPGWKCFALFSDRWREKEMRKLERFVAFRQYGRAYTMLTPVESIKLAVGRLPMLLGTRWFSQLKVPAVEKWFGGN